MTKKSHEDETSPSEEVVMNDTEALQKALEEATALANENWEKLLRKEAEMQNIRRRADNDVSNARKYGIERFAEELLAVVDSFEQALSIDADKEGAAKSMLEGIELTYNLLLGVMDKFGIKQLNPMNETFNPQFHEAIAMQESPDHEPNQIIVVFQKGFMVYDRVLRPARVVVAKV